MKMRNNVLRYCFFSFLLLVVVTIYTRNSFAAYIPLSPATASSAVNNGDAPNTIDGDIYTIWQAASTAPALQWIKYDLGESVDILGFQETTRTFPANSFTLFVSLDDSDYTEVASGTLTQYVFGEHFFPQQDVRYMKLYVSWNPQDGYGELAEFNALTTASIPVPSAVWLLGSGLLGLVEFRRKFRKE